MAVDNDGPVAEITLERYRLKELRADVAARLERRLGVDDQLRRRVDALALSDEQIRTSDRLELVAARVRHRLAAERTSERRAWTPAARWALPVAVAAGVALMALLPWTTFVPAGGDERIKGLDASLTLFRQVGAGSETLADGAVAHQGDVIRVGYRAAGRAYGVILSIDGRGTSPCTCQPAAIAPWRSAASRQSSWTRRTSWTMRRAGNASISSPEKRRSRLRRSSRPHRARNRKGRRRRHSPIAPRRRP